MYDDNLLDTSDNDLIIKETQESPATFGKNIINKFGICQTTNMGTDTVTNNNNKA